MAQFDVFENPIPRARRAYPFVVVLQSDIADTGSDRIVAPLAARARLPGTAGRLTPHVTLSGIEYVLLVPSLTAMRASDLRMTKGRLHEHREAIVAALDLLFLGV
jgi:toxin CcdB